MRHHWQNGRYQQNYLAKSTNGEITELTHRISFNSSQWSVWSPSKKEINKMSEIRDINDKIDDINKTGKIDKKLTKCHCSRYVMLTSAGSINIVKVIEGSYKIHKID